MKKLFLTKLAIFLVSIFMVISCEKKETMDMTGMDITMNYTPTPVIINTPTTITFNVKQDGIFTPVTMTSCEVIMNDGMAEEIVTSEIIPGQYVTTYSFPSSGIYELHFKYMHENVDTDKDFTITVQ